MRLANFSKLSKKLNLNPEDHTPISNFQPIRRLLDPDCYKFIFLMTNTADPDQLASEEAN